MCMHFLDFFLSKIISALNLTFDYICSYVKVLPKKVPINKNISKQNLNVLKLFLSSFMWKEIELIRILCSTCCLSTVTKYSVFNRISQKRKQYNFLEKDLFKLQTMQRNLFMLIEIFLVFKVNYKSSTLASPYLHKAMRNTKSTRPFRLKVYKIYKKIITCILSIFEQNTTTFQRTFLILLNQCCFKQDFVTFQPNGRLSFVLLFCNICF